MKRKKKKSGRYGTAALAVFMLAAAALSVYFMLTPGLEKQKDADRQGELLDSIKQGDGVIVLDERLAAEPVDYYDGGEEAPPEETMLFLAVLDAPPAGDAGAAGTDAAEPEPAVPGEISGLGILSIDKIDLKLPVSEGITSAQLKVSPGHVPQTAAIGETGNAVIAGHRSYEYGLHFNRLGEVALGDIIQYQPKDGAAMAFVVDEILEVLPGDQAAFEQPEDKAQITLYTCTPIRTATHRLLVRASRVI